MYEIEKIENLCCRILNELDANIDRASADEIGAAGQIVDMVKDLCVAKEKCVKSVYYAVIIDAVQAENESGRQGGRKYYTMTPEVYRRWSDLDAAEHMRDLDREKSGRLYYSDTNDVGNDMQEGRLDASRKGYIESREKHRGNTPAEKQERMKKLDAYMQELAGDVIGMIADASNEERAAVKQKLDMLAKKM